jgi:TPR repeat protein
MRIFKVARPAPCGVLLGLLLTGGCESGGMLGGVATGFQQTTIRPIERVLDGKSAEPGALETADAAYARALPVLRGQASEAETPQLVAELYAAAKAGHAPSQNLLGALHDHGRGFPKNAADAAYWYGQAAAQGLAVAKFNLGSLYRAGAPGLARDDVAAFGWFNGAAQQGHAEAQYQLALMLEDGIGTPRDAAAAVGWYQRAAQAGYAPAQHNLAVAYATSNGVAKDEARAAMWYRAAADQGLAASQLRLGLALAEGRGVARDLPEAWVRLMQAADNRGGTAELQSFAHKQARTVEARLAPAQLARARQELAERQQPKG